MMPRVVAEIENCQNWTLAQVERKVHEVFQQIFSGNFAALASDNAGRAIPEGQDPPVYEYKPQDGGYPRGGAVFEGQTFVADPAETGGNSRGIGAMTTSKDQFAQREFSGLPDVMDGYLHTGSQGGNTQDRGLETDRGFLDDMKAGFQKMGQKITTEFHEAGEAIDKFTDKLDPRQKALELIPHIREWIANIMRQHHNGLAEYFVSGSVEKAKGYMRGAISPREIATDVGGMATSLMSALKVGDGGANRDLGDSSRGIGQSLQGLFANKAMAGVRDIRETSRQLLHQEIIKREAEIWNNLPEGIRKPLEFVFGPDPFKQDGTQGGEVSRGIMDHGPFRMLKEAIQRLEQSMRNLVSGLVADAHRGFENGAIRQVEDVIMAKVHKVFPNAKLEE